ncbi:MAG: hypothetical protein GWO02_12700 [Gammaproteobacteria bacterium]|nr:hypothetical protein [Gammaproteobacteria bacterium]
MSEETEWTAAEEAEPLETILGELCEESGEVSGALVVSRDGLTMAAVGEGIDADRLGAMCSGLFASIDAASGELGCGGGRETIVRGEDGCAVLVAAGREAVLAIVGRPGASPGMMLLDARYAVERIARAI